MPETAESAKAGRDDVDIYCFRCDYSLKHCHTGRCPECGTPFDRAELVQWAYAPSVRFDRLKGHLGTGPGMPAWWAALFHPSRLGREMPVSVEVKSASRYANVCRMIVVGVGLVVGVAYFAESDSFSLVSATVAATVIWIFSANCESTIDSVIHRRVRWCYDPNDRCDIGPKPLSRFFSVFLAVHACVLGAMLIGALLHRSLVATVPMISLGIMTWWWYSLSRAMVARAWMTRGLLTSILHVSLIAVSSIAFGGALGALSVVLVWELFRY